VVWGIAWLAGLFAFALAARAVVLWWMLVLPLVAAAVEPMARAPRRRGIVVGQRIALVALVALLAIGRAFAAEPGRRSALFVWHGAEERGLMGSRWYVKHPSVDGSIVAVHNG
jgi:hypothetical protein